MTRRGLTLLEVLVASFVLCFGLLGLVAAVPALVRDGSRIESDLAIDREAEAVFAALREAARDVHVRWSPGPPSSPESAFLLLSHPAAREPGAPPVDPASPAVWGERACLLLPLGSDAVFVYPRAGDAAARAAANGNGSAAAARPADLDVNQGVEDLFLLPPADPRAAGLGFAVRLQRARVNRQPRDGLWLATVYFFRGPSGEGLESWRLVHHFTSELAAGPPALNVSAPPAHPEVQDPRDWLDAVRWNQVARQRAGGPR